jgi:hypothetical protein
MSPYLVTSLEAAQRFCTTQARIDIFRGFIEIRHELRTLGFVEALQWVDGSFCEDCERLHSRSPSDIDVVTLYRRPIAAPHPAAAWQLLIDAQIHNRDLTKQKFHCDMYYVDVDFPAFYKQRELTYWFGLFTHQRVTLMWKGMLAIWLGQNDNDAIHFLDALILPP